MQDTHRTQWLKAPLAVLHVDFLRTTAKLIFSMRVFPEDALQNSVQVAAPSNNEIYSKQLTARFEVHPSLARAYLSLTRQQAKCVERMPPSWLATSPSRGAVEGTNDG